MLRKKKIKQFDSYIILWNSMKYEVTETLIRVRNLIIPKQF
jgi:hypothetical protein